MKFGGVKYERELITLKDGGTMAIEWYVDSDGTGKPKTGIEVQTKPILLLF